jgi:predicted MFS family arabinose efflux permease
VPFLDELASGVAPASAPEIAADLGLSGGITAGAMLVAFHALALFVETPLLLWSERVRPRLFSAAALTVIGLSAITAALVPRAWALLLALSVYGPASGCALAISEGALVDRNPEERERAMARMHLAGCAGDLAVPLLLAALANIGLGWRTGFVLVGICALVLAPIHLRTPALSPAGSEESPPFRAAWKTALTTRGLALWTLAATSTNLLDEVLVAFGALHLSAIGASAAQRSWAIAGWVVGGFVGLFVVERKVTSARAHRALALASLASAIGLLLLALTRSVPAAAAALFVIGVFGSVLHPLAMAQAYASLPGRPAIVNAVASALLPLDIVAPLALAAIATRGTSSAVLALLVAPLTVAVVTFRFARRRGGRTCRAADR